jgi:5-methyltetrahydrofolate--homocysteine methyltransferase
MLQTIIAEQWLEARAVVGIFAANAHGDDIYVYGEQQQKIATFHSIRQQTKKPAGQANVALSDFILPENANHRRDYIGAFALTTGIGIDARVAAFEKNHDDYSAILLKALADRLAEAFAELMHQKVRTEIWAYASNENFSQQELIAEKYHGIRPAPGYPAQPDHTEKQMLWELLQVEKNAGITLTESMAMVPTAAVSGLYLAHPQAHYFGVGKITKQQVSDYAKRKNMSEQEAEKWLSPILAY